MSIHDHQIADLLQKHMALYGYELIDLPIIEPADLFLIKAGDPIISSLFTFERQNHQFALRPEFTAGAASHYTRLFGNQSPMARWQYHGPIFQDPPGNGSSTYQHYSIGAELIGMGGAIADTEIISMSAHGLTAVGVSDFQLTIGHTGLTRRLLSRFQLDTRIERFLLHHSAILQDPGHGKSHLVAQLKRLYAPEQVASSADEILQFQLDKSTDFIGGRSRQDIARRLLQKRKGAAAWEQIIAATDFLDQWGQIAGPPPQVWDRMRGLIGASDEVSQQILAEFQSVINLLEICGIPAEQMRIKPSLARSWEYYTGIVFELASRDGINVGGGGRYNELIQLISQHPATPAVGFAYNMINLAHAIGEVAHTTNPPMQLYITPTAHQAGMRWAHLLRQQQVATAITSDVAAQTTAPLRIDETGNCHARQRIYTLDEIEQLVAELKEVKQ